MSCGVLIRLADEMSEKAYRAVGRIHSAAERASGLIRDLLDFTKARTAGGISILPQLVDLADLARRATEEVQAMYPDHSLQFENSGDAEGYWTRHGSPRSSRTSSRTASSTARPGRPSSSGRAAAIDGYGSRSTTAAPR